MRPKAQALAAGHLKTRVKDTVWVDAFDSPIGRIWAASDSSGIIRVLMPPIASERTLKQEVTHDCGKVKFAKGGLILAAFFEELTRYFSGSLKSFSTPARPSGTAFQKRVWDAVARIPYGRTESYGWIAERIGSHQGARAVGQANRVNPVPLLVPCHRVTACGGKLGGYSAGLDKKRWLLRLERQASDTL